MTVSTSANRADYNGNGTTTAFAVPFYFPDPTNLQVLSTVIATGVSSVLVLNSDYTVVGAGVSTGGTITTTVAPASTIKITVLLNLAFVQTTHYVANDPFPAASHEAALDYLTLLTKQTAEVASRSLSVPPGESGAGVVLPVAPSRANNLLGFDSNGNPIAVAPAAGTATALAAQLASGVGSSGVGSVQTGAGAVARTVQAELRETYNAAQFGVTFDNVTDDTVAWNLLILRVSQAGGGTILGRNGATSYVAGATGLLIPSNVRIDLRGATLRGTGNASGANILVNSGKVSAGALVLNTLADPVTNAGIFNGTLYQAATALSVRYCIDGCRFNDLQLVQTYNGVYAQFCLYALFDHITARNTSTGTAFRFSNNCNAITVRNCYAVGSNPGTWTVGFQFDAKTYGAKLLNCSSEFCLTGIVTEELHGFSIDGHYFESCATRGIDLQSSAFRKIGVDIKGCYFSNVPHLLYGRTVNGLKWAATNERAANCSPGDIDLQTDTSVSPAANSECTGLIELNDSTTCYAVSPTGVVGPSWMTLSDGIELKMVQNAVTSTAGLATPVYAKANCRTGPLGGVVTNDFAGFDGSPPIGVVPFSAVVIPTGASVSATVTTTIAINGVVSFWIARLTIVDSGGTWFAVICGEGTAASTLVSTLGGRTLSYSASGGGFLVITIAGVTNAAATATITGMVKKV